MGELQAKAGSRRVLYARSESSFPLCERFSLSRAAFLYPNNLASATTPLANHSDFFNTHRL
jgi:hypothetical protein